MKAVLLCALALVGCAFARTASRTPAVTAHITSLTDKDARTKAMTHPAFANAGRQAGLEIWRIEDFDPVPVPATDYGKFYKGDSYIVLKTTANKKGDLSWDIHYWIGAESSQDEAGAAAILTVGLDDKFNGAAVQHRETMGYESSQFTGYFQPAIRYLDGGHASGFHHVTTNAGAEKRLFQIKGKRNVRVRQVDPVISSMNKGDVFILDVDHDIYVYVGERAKNVERLKAISVANQIRDQDHNGRAKVEIIDQYSSEVDVQKFFAALGSGNRDLVPEESAGGEDQQFERSEEQSVTLSEISDSSGAVKITPLTKPFKQEQLRPQEVYILDTVSGSIYVWVGKQSTDREKAEAMTKAQQYLTAKKYPSWVHVARIPQGTEPAVFKQYFSTWRDVGMAHSRIVRSVSDEELYASDEEVSNARARRIGKTGAARSFMPDDGQGQFTVYRIDHLQLVKVYESSSARAQLPLYQGDCYVILYQNGDTPVIYYWLGKDSTMDEQASAAMNAVLIDSSLKNKAVLVRVPQGEEPTHLLKIFNGRLVTLSGGKSPGFRNSQQTDDSDTDGDRLFRISGTASGVDMRVDQVPKEALSLQTDDVFLLDTIAKAYIWQGRGSSEAERQEAAEFVRGVLGAGGTLLVLDQGQEPADFWTSLGGDATQVRPGVQWREQILSSQGFEPRLLEASFSNENKVTFQQLHEFQQSNLQEDEAYVLDAGNQIFVWIGAETHDQLRKAGARIAQEYQTVHKNADVVAILIKQGLEPEAFTKYFDKWDPQMWIKQRTYEQDRDRELAENEIDVEK